MKIFALLFAVMLGGCATSPVLNADSSAQSDRPLTVQRGDIGFRLPNAGWFVAEQRPFWARAFIVERNTDVALIVGLETGLPQEIAASKRLGLARQNRNLSVSLGAIEESGTDGVYLFRLYDLNQDGKPFHCVLHAFRRLTGERPQTATVTGQWFIDDDGRYTNQALDLLRSIEHLQNE